MSGMDGVEWNGRSGIGMGWRSGLGLRSPERVGKTSETSENVGGGLNEIWYMTILVYSFDQISYQVHGHERLHSPSILVDDF